MALKIDSDLNDSAAVKLLSDQAIINTHPAGLTLRYSVIRRSITIAYWNSARQWIILD